MLVKSKIVEEIERAKIAHQRWIKRVENLISGLPIDKDMLVLDISKCGYGVWLYAQSGHRLNLNRNFKKDIEILKLHQEHLFELYEEIQKVFTPPSKESLLQKLIPSKRRADKKLLQEYLMVFESSANEMEQNVQKFIRKIDKIDSYTILNAA